MTTITPSPEVREWLSRNGWSSGRDIGAEAEELVRIRLRDAERQGERLTPVDAAVRIIREYGGLRLAHPRVTDLVMEMDPTGGYDGDAAAILELTANLGKQLFPVGYESREYGLILVDEIGRFFHLHHTGAYFWGSGEYEAFAFFLGREDALDAEDFFV
ncbi:hypothetical protein GPA10_39985 [Streptomyces sp. p1417]|uniref:SUKH-3 immunity protein n=1 Tax=Streptomyces typhae TaxID=2681492 RepID=A0A6L6XAQ7_9ACTN|nr:hypothetical protein [Streptomyces typhae]